MICENCKKDYRDVPEGIAPGHFYRSDDHYYKNYRRFGWQCTNCGFIAELITKSTGLPYKKREIKDDPDQIVMFDDMAEQEEKPVHHLQTKKIHKHKVREQL